MKPGVDEKPVAWVALALVVGAEVAVGVSLGAADPIVALWVAVGVAPELDGVLVRVLPEAVVGVE